MARSITYKDKNSKAIGENSGISRILPATFRTFKTIRTFKTLFEVMKKVYIAPQTEATELIATTVLMASAGGGLIPPFGGTGTSGEGGSPR